MRPLLRFVLALLPGEFQHAYRADLDATVRAQQRDASSRPADRRFLWSTIADVCKVAPGLHWDILRRDSSVAWRSMAARPLHTATAALTLALGVGAAVAIFAVLDAVWLQPLPYRNASELVTVGETGNGSQPGPMGYLTFLELRGQSHTLAQLAAASQSIATMTGDGGEAERIALMRASANYFEMVGVAPALGRAFADTEDRPGAARRVVILSDRLWKRRFNGDPAVLRRSIDLNGVTFRIVGVMPAGFEDLVAARLYNNAEAWTPLGYDPSASFACRTCRHLRVFGRLATGRSPAEADRELSLMIAASAAAHPTEYDHPAIRVVPLGETFFAPIRRTLIVLAVAVGLLLLVACGNVSNLLLLRATERSHEVAVRTALGVTVPRLARQFLTESILLAVVGGMAGLPLAWAITRFFVRLAPPQLPRLANVTLDGRALSAALVLVVGSGVLFGLAPLAQFLRRSWAAGIQGAGRRTVGHAAWRLRAALVAFNVAMAAVLLVGSGLLVRSLGDLLAVDVGFNPDRVLTLRVSVGGARFATSDNAANISATTTFYDDVFARVRALPGVEAVAGVTTLPLGGDIDGYGLHVLGRPEPNPEAAPGADRFVVTPDYFRVAGVPLADGRLLDATDRQGAPSVVVVNATLAREIFPGENAIGHRVALGGPDGPPRTIVGVVGDVRHRSLDVPAGYQVYVPQAQWSWAETDLTLLVRGHGDPSSLAGPIRTIIKDVDPAQAVGSVMLYDNVVAAATATRRVAAEIIGLFAVTALILAIVGLSGALGVVARQRQQEIGVRMALGANAALIKRLILRQGLRPAIVGLVSGLAAAAASAGALRSLLYGVGEFDPITFGGVSLVLLSAAVFACLIPAWRASRTSPVVALRSD